MMNIEIMVSTYNGEKYLKGQLNSILGQKCRENIKVSIRDDGSNDNTVNILKEYEKYNNFNITYGENIGINASMMELVKNSEPNYDFFAFSDQDDVWDENKIQLAIDYLRTESEVVPLLWGCMEELVDENMNKISMMPTPKYLGVFYSAIIQNKIAGHTQVFNRALRDVLVGIPSEKMYLYDWMVYIIASAVGIVFFEKKCCGEYRQHANNAIGYELNALAQIPRRFKYLKNGAFKKISMQMEYVYITFKNDLQLEHRKELERFFKSRRNVMDRIIYSLTTKFKRNSWFESLQFRILYMLGFF